MSILVSSSKHVPSFADHEILEKVLPYPAESIDGLVVFFRPAEEMTLNKLILLALKRFRCNISTYVHARRMIAYLTWSIFPGSVI